jgi:hypothetical protein
MLGVDNYKYLWYEILLRSCFDFVKPLVPTITRSFLMNNPKTLYQAILDKYDKHNFYFSYVRDKQGGIVERNLTISREDFAIIPTKHYIGVPITFLADADFKNVEFVDVDTFQARGHYGK